MQGGQLDSAAEDVTLTYGYLAARRFAADYQVLAWSGATQSPVVSSSGQAADAHPPAVPQLFDQLIAGNSSSHMTNLSWVPQVNTVLARQYMYRPIAFLLHVGPGVAWTESESLAVNFL